MNLKTKTIFLASFFLIVGCEGQRFTQREKGALTGGALGAGLGAIIGNQVGNSGAGIAIGTAAGALAGGLIGEGQESQRQEAESQEERMRRQEEELRRQRRELEELRRGESGSDYGYGDNYNGGYDRGRDPYYDGGARY
jgi:uncharacterized protein YcfJ